MKSFSFFRIPAVLRNKSTCGRGLGTLQRPQRPASANVSLRTSVFALAITVLIGNLLMCFVGAWSTGISTDDPTHMLRLKSYFQCGWYVPEWQLDNCVPRSDVQDAYVYGPFFSLLAEAVASLLGASADAFYASDATTYHEVLVAARIYQIRHVLVAVFGSLGLLAIAGSVRVALGSWRWGVLGAAVLSAVPAWAGNCTINIKDTPVAAGIALVALGAILLSSMQTTIRPRTALLAATCVFCGMLCAVGTRPGVWPIIGTMLLVSLAASLALNWRLSCRQPAIRALFVASGTCLLSSVAAYLVFLILYPEVFSTPVKAAWLSASGSAHYSSWNNSSLTNGVIHGQPPPWWYLPTWTLHQVPTATLALAVLGGISTSVLTIRMWVRRESTPRFGSCAVSWATTMTLVILVPTTIIALSSHVYSGLRQVLFAIPALATLAVNGIWWMYRHQAATCPLARVGRDTLVAAALVLPSIEQYRLFPYFGAYFNEIASLSPINGNWPVDDGHASYREFVSKLARDTPVAWMPTSMSTYPSDLNAGRASPPTFDYCLLPTAYPFCNEEARVTNRQPARDNAYIVANNTRLGVEVPNGCTVYDQVTRPLRGEDLVLAYAVMCEREIREYPSRGISFLGKGGGEYLLWGWSAPEQHGVWTLGERSALAMRIPEQLMFASLRLRLTGFRLVPKNETRTVRLFANGHYLGESKFNDKHRVTSLEFQLPDPKHRKRELIIRFENDRPVSPASIGGEQTDTRLLGFFLDSLHIEPVLRP